VGGVCAWRQHLSLTMRKADWLTIGAWWLSFLHTCERRDSETRYRGWAMGMVFRACVKVWERMVGSQRMKEAQARGRCSICVWVYPSRMERQLLEARLIIIYFLMYYFLPDFFAFWVVRSWLGDKEGVVSDHGLVSPTFFSCYSTILHTYTSRWRSNLGLGPLETAKCKELGQENFRKIRV